MNVQNVLNQGRVRQSGADVSVPAVDPQPDASHLLRPGRPALHTQGIQRHGSAEGGGGQQRGQSPLPASPEHPEGLAQQHGGDVVPNHAGCRHAEGQGNRVGGAGGLIAREEHAVESHTPGEGGAEGEAVAEDGLHPPHGHHVPGALAPPPAVQGPGAGQQDHARQGVHGDEPAVDQRRGLQDGLFPALGGHDLRILRVHVQPSRQVQGGAQKLHNALIGPLHAEVEHGHEPRDQPLGPGGDEVEDEIEGREGEGVAGDEDHRRGGGEVEKAQSQNAEDGHGQAHGLHASDCGEDEDGQGSGDGVGNQHHGKTREEVREEDPLPGDGQCVVHPHAPGVVQPAPGRQGAQDRVQQGEDGDDPGHHRVTTRGSGQGVAHGLPEKAALPDEDGEEGQGEQGPHEGRAAPQWPEPAEVLLEERGIKVRCL